MSSVDQILAARTQAAEALLRDAVRVEVVAFVSRQLEERLRARPHFLGRTPQVALYNMRLELEREGPRLAAQTSGRLDDLRAFVGAAPRSETEESEAVAKVLSFVVEAVQELLTIWCFPGDNRPDRGDQSGVDLDAQYRLTFTPSANLLFAWRKVRALDTVRNQLADAAGRDVPHTLEMKLYLPEALPLDKT